MTATRDWAQVKQLFHDALELAPDGRTTEPHRLLRIRACGPPAVRAANETGLSPTHSRERRSKVLKGSVGGRMISPR